MTKRMHLAMILGSAVLATSGLFLAGLVGGLRVNVTPSYPVGLWQAAPLDREPIVGDLVFICLPFSEGLRLAGERGYLGWGLCPGWFTPLIKRIAATAGQRVEINKSVRIDGVPVARSDVRAADGKGRGLLPHEGGIVPEGHLFLLSDFAGSYDSRYFGPVPAAGIIGLAQPIFTASPQAHKDGDPHHRRHYCGVARLER